MVKFNGLKVVISLTVAAVLTLSASGCSKKVSSGGASKKPNLKGVTVDFRGYRDWQTDKEFSDFATGIAKFKQDYPGVEVKTSVGGGYGYDKDMVVAVAAGDVWDLQYAQDSLGVPSSAVQGLVEPLDKYIDWSDPFYDKKFMDLWKLGDHYYGIGNKGFQDFLFLWYKRSDFESAGLKTPYELYKEGRWNFDSALDAARVLTKYDEKGNGKQVLFFTSAFDYYSSQGIVPYIFNNNDGKLTLNIDTPEMRDYLQYVYEMGYKLKSVNVKGGQVVLQPMFTTYFGDDSHISKWSSEGREIVPLPTKDGKAHTYMHDNYLTVPKGAKNKQAAVILAKYVCQAREQYMNTAIEKTLSPEQFKLYNELTSDFNVARINFPGIDNFLSVSNAKGEAVKIVTEGKPVSSFIDEMKERIQPQVDLYNANYATKADQKK